MTKKERIELNRLVLLLPPILKYCESNSKYLELINKCRDALSRLKGSHKKETYIQLDLERDIDILKHEKHEQK